MTSRGAYEAILTELRKAKAPSLHVEDYLYFINKGVQEYANERYNKFQINQQVTDDLTPLIASDSFIINSATAGYYASKPAEALIISTGKKYNSSFVKFSSPANYWHMTASHVNSFTKFPTKCAPVGYDYFIPSKRLTANTGAAIINNEYLKPAVDRVYHDFTDSLVSSSTLPTFTYYFGDAKKFGLKTVTIDYLKKPEKIFLTQSQIDLPTDQSMTLEFPEYSCNEIIKRAVKLILENSSDPRLNTNVPINQSIP
jgi:hypothetical protein